VGYTGIKIMGRSALIGKFCVTSNAAVVCYKYWDSLLLVIPAVGRKITGIPAVYFCVLVDS